MNVTQLLPRLIICGSVFCSFRLSCPPPLLPDSVCLARASRIVRSWVRVAGFVVLQFLVRVVRAIGRACGEVCSRQLHTPSSSFYCCCLLSRSCDSGDADAVDDDDAVQLVHITHLPPISLSVHPTTTTTTTTSPSLCARPRCFRGRCGVVKEEVVVVVEARRGDRSASTQHPKQPKCENRKRRERRRAPHLVKL